MSEKRPQPVFMLTKRLRRVAKWLDQMAYQDGLSSQNTAQRRARANTCLQVAGRLDDVQTELCNLIVFLRDLDSRGRLGLGTHERIKSESDRAAAIAWPEKDTP